MTKREQYIWFGIFALGTIAYTIVQDNIRPASKDFSSVSEYLLGIAPNYFAGVCLPSFFMAMISYMVQKNEIKTSHLTIHKLNIISLVISIAGLLTWEFIQIKTRSGHFDPHDILWTLFGSLTFMIIYRSVHNKTSRQRYIVKNRRN